MLRMVWIAIYWSGKRSASGNPLFIISLSPPYRRAIHFRNYSFNTINGSISLSFLITRESSPRKHVPP